MTAGDEQPNTGKQQGRQITIHNPDDLLTVDYRELKPLQGNLKDLSKLNYEKLRNVLERRGFTTPVFVWEAKDGTKYLMDGHQRQRVMQKADMNDDGSYDVPYVRIEADSKEHAKAQLLEITSQYGTITQEGFDEFTAELPEFEYKDVNFDALAWGDDADEPEVVEDEAPEVDESEPAKSKLGEVYQLGRHRLMCGSATEEVDIARLLDGSKVDLVFTDPPYGVSYTSKKLGSIKNDDLAGDALYQFVRDSFLNVLPTLTEGAAVYCWYEDKFRHLFQAAIEDAGYEFKQNVIWNKGMNLSGADYQKAHENCLYMQVKGSRARWYGGRDKKTILGLRRRDVLTMKKTELAAMLLAMQNEQTVWDFDRDSVTAYVHPTQKPVKLAATAIRNSTKANQTVLDMFGGSGSTMIAAHQTSRQSFTMEFDPKFCDVIRKRYWIFINGEEEGWEEATPTVEVTDAVAA